MNRDHWQLKNKLNELARRAAEDAQINASELSYWPAFWVVVIAVVLGLLFAPR